MSPGRNVNGGGARRNGRRARGPQQHFPLERVHTRLRACQAAAAAPSANPRA